jgi:hypothetical protein
MGGPRIHPERVAAVRELKAQGMTDHAIAQHLNLTYHQVHYIRSLHGIGGRYARYAHHDGVSNN